MNAPARQDARFRERYGPWALVAGGSEGIGAAFAGALAARGLNLVLLARRIEPLQALAAALEARHGVEVRVEAQDLAAPDLAARVMAATGDLEIGLLVCSAAVSQLGAFLDLPLDDELAALDVNCRASVILARVLGERMRTRRRGGIVIMSSLAGLYGGPYVATYAATKAFGCLLAESLNAELRPLGVDVLACVAGPTRTPTYQRQLGERMHPMSPEAVVAAALSALGRRPRVIPGAKNRLITWLLLRLPRSWVLPLIAARTRRQ